MSYSYEVHPHKNTLIRQLNSSKILSFHYPNKYTPMRYVKSQKISVSISVPKKRRFGHFKRLQDEEVILCVKVWNWDAFLVMDKVNLALRVRLKGQRETLKERPCSPTNISGQEDIQFINYATSCFPLGNLFSNLCKCSSLYRHHSRLSFLFNNKPLFKR